MQKKAVIGVVARMDWHSTLVLLPAMGRTRYDTVVVQDVETAKELGPGLKKRVINMVFEQGAVELFVIGSSSTEKAEDIMDRVKKLRECGEIPENLPIHGLLIDPETYKLDLVHRGYKNDDSIQGGI